MLHNDQGMLVEATAVVMMVNIMVAGAADVDKRGKITVVGEREVGGGGRGGQGVSPTASTQRQ